MTFDVLFSICAATQSTVKSVAGESQLLEGNPMGAINLFES